MPRSIDGKAEYRYVSVALPGEIGANEVKLSILPKAADDMFGGLDEEQLRNKLVVFRMAFVVDRTGPLEIRTGEGNPVRRTERNTWAPFDNALAFRERGALSVRWVDPLEGTQFVLDRVDLVDVGRFDSVAPKYDILQDYGKYWPAGKVKQAGSLAMHKLFWMSFDLATSFNQLQAAGSGEAAKELIRTRIEELTSRQTGRLFEGVAFPALDPLRCELLLRYLMMRALNRAALCSSGTYVQELLPAASGFQRDAEGIATLILELVRYCYPPPAKQEGKLGFDDDGCWEAVLLFASGNLRRYADPGSAETGELNIEPNGSNYLALPEVFDVALEPSSSSLESNDYLDCLRLRTIFASSLEPFLDVYRGGRMRPRRASEYRWRGKDEGEGSTGTKASRMNAALREPGRGWRLAAVRAFQREYSARSPKRPSKESLEWFFERWGDAVGEGLRDEHQVHDSRMAAKGPRREE